MRKSHKKAAIIPKIKYFKVNEQIKAPKVRVLDEDGKHLGIMSSPEALKLAQEKELDLIEIAPQEETPVVKIIKYGKYQYQLEKKLKKQKIKQKKVEVKGIRLSLRISPHDINLRLEQAKKFLSRGDKLKIELVLRGRERQHFDLAREIINKFLDSLNKKLEALKPPLYLITELPLSKQGGNLSLILRTK